MRLDELKFVVPLAHKSIKGGPYYKICRAIPGYVIYFGLRPGFDSMHRPGEYSIEGIGDPPSRNYYRLDPITAQAIIHELLKGNP
jgi:hypothetical protein